MSHLCFRGETNNCNSETVKLLCKFYSPGTPICPKNLLPLGSAFMCRHTWVLKPLTQRGWVGELLLHLDGQHLSAKST